MSQSRIGRVLRGTTVRERSAAILSQERFDSRRSFGRRVCREFSFVDALGRPRVAGGLKALSALSEEDPRILLPPPAAVVDATPRQLPAGVAEPGGVPDHPSRIGGLEFAVASTPPDRALRTC